MPSLADIKRDMNRICPGSVIDGVEVKDVERIPLRAAALNRALQLDIGVSSKVCRNDLDEIMPRDVTASIETIISNHK